MSASRMFIGLPVLLAVLVAIAGLGLAIAQEPDADEARERQTAERFLSILEKNPRRGTTLDRVYGFHVERGTLESAIASIREKASNATGRAAAPQWMIVGLMESMRGQDAVAVEAFANAEKLDPTNTLAPFYRGQSLVLIGQPDQATEAMEVAIARKPVQTDLLEMFEALGRIHQRAQRPEQAMEVWNRFEKMFPNDTRVQEQIASTLLDEGELAAALPRFERLATTVKDQYRQSQFRIEAADIKVRLGRRDEAMRDFEKLIGQLNPDNWLFRDVRRRIEEIFLRSGDHEGLIAYYTTWLGKNPEDLDAVSRVVRLLAGLGRAEESQAWLQKALKAAPSRKNLRHTLIAQLLFEQKHAQAIAQYELLDKYEPNNPDTLRDWGRLILKDASRDEGTRKKDAAIVWRRLMAARPRDPLVVSQVAELFRHGGMTDEALELYRKAIELSPEDAQYKEYLGEFYHVLQRKEEALSTWRSIAEGKAKTPPNVARLAEVLAGFGYVDEAIATNAEACRLDPRDINLQLKRADLLADTGRHDEALQQLAIVRKMAASDEEREAWLTRELKEWQQLGKMSERISELQESALTQSQTATLTATARQELVDRWLWLARALEAERRWKEASAAAASAAALAPDSIPILKTSARIMESQSNLVGAVEINQRLSAIDRRFRTEYQKKIARLEILLGRHDKALAAGRDVIASAPGNPEVYEFFSQICFQIGESEEGLQSLRRAVRVAPSDQKGLLTLGAALAEQFRSEEAIELYWRAFDKSATLDERLVVVPKLAELYLQSNQFDRILERLERQRREPNLQREMTICLSQAYHAAGDDGNARKELEKLLTEDTRDTQLLLQLVKLCETESDFEVAIRYQQQLNKVAPGREGLMRLSQLLMKHGDLEEARALIVRVAAEEKDPEALLRSIDALLSSEQTEQALPILQRLVRDQPNNWELLYRLGVALSESAPDEALQRFEGILALATDDGELSLAAASAVRRAARHPVNQPVDIDNQDDHTLSGRLQHASDILQATRLQNRQYMAFGSPNSQGPIAIWVPTDYGQARMAAYAWLMSFARERGSLQAFKKDKLQALAESTRWRDLIDLFYLSCLDEGPTQTYRVLRDLSKRPGADREIRKMYIEWLSQRGPVDESEHTDDVVAEVPNRPDMTGMSEDNDDEENLYPLPPDELQHVISIIAELRAGAEQNSTDDDFINILIAELKRSGREEEADKVFAEAVKSAQSPREIDVVLQGLLATKDYDTSIELVDKLIDLGIQRGTGNVQFRFDYPQLVVSPDNIAHKLAQLMAMRVARNKKAKADDELDGLIDLWKKYVRRVMAVKPVKQTQIASSLQRHETYHDYFGYSIWNSEGDEEGQSIEFPQPNEDYSSGSIHLLLQLSELYREADRLDDLIDAFETIEGDAETPKSHRRFWAFGRGYLQWWNDDRDTAIATLQQAMGDSPDSVSLQLALAHAREEQQEYAEALELIDTLSPADHATLQQREVMALRLAVNTGNADRARVAASRLFGLRLDSNLQMALAQQMHRLGMHKHAEAVLARAGRQAGNKTDVLLQLMQQYMASEKQDTAIQIAMELLRRTRPPNQRNRLSGGFGFHHHWFGNDDSEIRKQALQVLNQSGKLPELIAKLESQLSTSPKSERLLESLIEFQTATGNTRDVEDLNARLTQARIDDPQVRFEHALDLLSKNKNEEADEHLKIAVRKNPRLLVDNSWRLMDGLSENPEVFATILEQTDLKMFRANSHVLAHYITRLMGNPKTNERAVALFKKTWNELPDARNSMLLSLDQGEFSQLTDIFEYARQGIIPNESTIADQRWFGMGMELSESDGRLVTLCSTVLDLCSSQGKLDELNADVSESLKRLTRWQGGKLLLAMIDLRRGQVEQGRIALEANLPLVIQLIRRDSDHGSTIAREVGQELALYDSSRPLAVRYYEAAMGNGRNQNGDYKQSLSRQIAELLKGMGRNEDARKVLNRFVESTLRENNRGFANSETVFLLGDDFVRLGYGADAVRIFRIMLSNRSAMNNSPETEKQLKKRLPETIALISPDSVGDLFKPLPKTNPNLSHDWIMPHGFSFGLPLRRLANSQESTKEDETDLGLTVSSRAELPGNLASTILDLTADIARHPALRQAAMNNIHAAREKSPDDIGLIIIAAQLAIVSNADNERLAAMSELMESIARLPLPPTGDRQPTAKQRLEASRQVAVWLIAKQGLADKSLKGSAEKLAERALEAASFDADSTQSLAILHDWIRLAHDSKDEERVVQLLERLVDEIVHSRDGERKKGRAADGAALASLDQFQKIANVARLATTLGHPQFGIKTLARTMRHGPPRETLGPADPENPFGQQDNINSQSSAQILREVHLLLELWSSSAITDMDRYELLRELVLPASQPARIYLYVDSSANIEHNWPRSLGNLLIIAAIKSGRVDEIRSLAAARLNQPLIELAARVFLGQLAVVTRDHDAAVEQLDFLIDRLSRDSLAQTGSLACHVVLPAMLTPELKAKSNQALAVIVSQLHKSIVSRRPSSSDQVALLTLLLARRYLQDGQDQQAIELLESWISLQSIVWANYDDASAARYRKGVYAQVAHEYAQFGNVDKMMEMLGRFADLPVAARYEEGFFDEAEATILNLLAAMETSNRYERLKNWTLPGKGRQNIRIFAGVIRSDHRPAAFEQLRGSAPADPARSRLTSTLEMLLDAARELDKLDELQREFKAASNDGGIDAACANAAIQIVRGQAADVLPELRKRNSADIEEDRYSQRDRTDRRTHDAILARLALQSSDASIREQGLAMGNWVTVSQRHLAADMRYAIATSKLDDAHVAKRLDQGSTGLKHWVAGSSVDSRAGHPHSASSPWWVSSENVVTHPFGTGEDCLHFAYPLDGQFDVECNALAGNFANGNLGFAGLIFQGLHGGNYVNLTPVGRERESIQFPGPPDKTDELNHVRLSVRGDLVTYYVNGYPITEYRQSPTTFPFVTLYSRQLWNSPFFNVRITGTPTVPRTVQMVHGNVMVGWVSDYFREIQPRFLPLDPDSELNDELLENHSRRIATRFDWAAIDGEIQGHILQHVPVGMMPAMQSRLYYNRPMRNAESIRYEFWYSPGDGGFHVHPALDRLAFQFDPDGVRLHWITRSNNPFGEQGLKPDNAVVDVASRRGPARLPLKSNDWNQVLVSLDKEMVTISLNDTIVCERQLEPDNSRQFGFYRDKNRYAARIRNVVMSGDWPKSVGPEILDHLFEHEREPTVEERMAHGRVTDEHVHRLSVDSIMRHARALPAEQRYAVLKAWVLPNDAHASFRLYGSMEPAGPAQQVARSRIQAPALDLIAAARELGRLDQLEREIRTVVASTELARRAQRQMLGLIAIDRNDTAGIQAIVTELASETLSETTGPRLAYELWGDILLLWNLATIPELKASGRSLAERTLIPWTDKANRDGQTFGRAAYHRLRDRNDPDRPISAVSPKSQWIHATTAAADDRAWALKPNWQFVTKGANHSAGFGEDMLIFQSPLRGRFTVDCEMTSGAGREVGLMYDARSAHVSPQLDGIRTLVFNPDLKADSNSVNLKFPQVEDWSAVRMEVHPGMVAWYAKDRKMMEHRLSPQSSPWLAIHAPGSSGGSVRNLRISGKPVVPEEVSLIPKEGLEGWVVVTGLQPSQAWSQSSDEITAQRQDRLKGRHYECVLQYFRPLCEDGELTYEFFHVPGQSIAQPTLGRMAFLLEPEGVVLHQVTDGEFERTGVAPDNRTVEKECRRGTNLPLKPGTWNAMKLTLLGDRLSLTLNSHLIYERDVAGACQRHFGFFQDTGETDVRVRNVVYRGRWPKAAPDINDQELAGEESLNQP